MPLLAGSGIDGLAGISGPPQSDATLSEARKATGPDITLWGGIPQDYVMPMVDLSLLIESIEAAKAFAAIDNRTIIGIADHVPVEAEFSRLKEISQSNKWELTRMSTGKRSSPPRYTAAL